MKYTKPALTFQKQAQLLINRGLVVDDKQELEIYLSRVNYYRLSGYWFPFKHIDPITGDESIKPGTTFTLIRDLYEFDRKLRLLFLNAIERIEVSIFRTQLVEINTNSYGPFGYTDQKNYNPKFIAYDLQKLLDDISEDEDRSKEEFTLRYRKKYDEEKYLPLWMAAELMSFGQLLTLYRNQHLSIKQAISHRFKLFPQVLDSWLLTLNAVRNSCAHHNRLWNRPLPLVVRFPDQKYDPRWYVPQRMPDNRLYTALTMINYLLAYIAPFDHWKQSVIDLLVSYPSVSISAMGMPENWQESSLWK